MRECQQCKQCFPDAVVICPEDGVPTFHSIDGNPILEGKYRLEKRLGQGGMGVVYCARHTYLKSQYAIKVILPDLVGNDPQLVTRFRQEALAAAAIRHHNVVSVTDYGVAQDTMPFLVMEFVEGESLHDLLDREKRLSPEKAVELMAAICSGVGAAHRQGIVHRDLKPLNVMICEDKPNFAEGVKILDFGLAKIKSGELLGSFIQAQTTGLMGSPYYMSPEQWADEEPDAQADIYSLGIMLYQMLAGDVPFKGSSIPAIMKKHLSDPPPTFAEMGVQVPPQIEAAVRHALEKNREARTQTVEELVQELRRSLGYPTTQPLHMTGGLPATENPPQAVSTVHVLTSPPQSKVFVDNVHVGESQNDGWLLVEGLQSGNHRLRISKEGFQDWENQIFCEGKPQQVVAQLQSAIGFTTNIIEPTHHITQNKLTQNTPQNLGNTQGMQSGSQQNYSQTGNQQNYSQSGMHPSQQNWQQSGSIHQTAPPPQNWQSGPQYIPADIPVKKSGVSPLVIAIAGIFGLLLLTGIGGFAAYQAGFFGGGTNKLPDNVNGNIANNNSNANSNTQKPPDILTKNELVVISGGKFKMGNNEGSDREQPEHEIEVKDFSMDKTEVTNAEYAEFVKEENYRAPEHWANGKPLAGEEMLPVSRVSVEDAKAFAVWRSKRDGVEYRLPTEAEWEYAARNGSADNLYPWGDRWEENRAVLNQNSLKPVGSSPNGANKWGVQDLIGNISEWTSSEFTPYPNGRFKAPAEAKNTFATRGGSYIISSSTSKITSATRFFAPPTAKDLRLGFRLVRSN